MVPVIYLFEHGHIDLEWIKRAGVYSDYIKGIINNVITTLRSDDDRRYIIGQPLVVADALNSPEFTGDRFSYYRSLSELLTDVFINYDKSVKPGDSLPKSYSFLDFNPGRLAVTAVKKAEAGDSLIYRLFNPTNHPESIQVNDYLLTDLLEENSESINELRVEPFGIYTLKKLL